MRCISRSSAASADRASSIENKARGRAERTGVRGANDRAQVAGHRAQRKLRSAICALCPYNSPMAIILSHPMTSQEMRVLQEFRRVAAETLPVAAIKAIKHPAGGGEAPANSLVTKGYLSSDA